MGFLHDSFEMFFLKVHNATSFVSDYICLSLYPYPLPPLFKNNICHFGFIGFVCPSSFSFISLIVTPFLLAALCLVCSSPLSLGGRISFLTDLVPFQSRQSQTELVPGLCSLYTQDCSPAACSLLSKHLLILLV